MPSTFIKILFVTLGTAFGFILSRAGATTHDFYAKLFLFEDMQLMWVIGVAGGLLALSVTLLRRVTERAVVSGTPIPFQGKPYRKTLVPGALLFGAGWGLAGACPGTAMAMLGEGKLGALFAVIGVALGTYFYGVWRERTDATAVPCT